MPFLACEKGHEQLVKFQTKIANASFRGPSSSFFKDQTPTPNALVLPRYIPSTKSPILQKSREETLRLSQPSLEAEHKAKVTFTSMMMKR